MRESKKRHGRNTYTVRNMVTPASSEEWPNLMISTNVDVIRVPERNRLELLLTMGDSLLFFGICAIMLGLVKMTGAQIHDGYFLLLNMALGSSFALSFRYFDLTESRYSLGKAFILVLSLWLMNGLALQLTGQLTLAAMAVVGVVLAVGVLISGPIHYELGRPYTTRDTKNLYYQVEQGIKRVVDLTASLLGLFFLLPLLTGVTLLVCIESKGSPIYKQTRIGLGEKKFKMYKFRSMVSDAEKIALARLQVLYKRDDDPRITRFGRLIRKLSVDELPQLWNVVTGDMSLVGPRPPIEREYVLMNWYHKRKFEVKPGLTGLWQVQGRVKNERDFNSVAAYDITYLESWCLMEDVKILLKTIPVVLLQKGAC